MSLLISLIIITIGIVIIMFVCNPRWSEIEYKYVVVQEQEVPRVEIIILKEVAIEEDTMASPKLEEVKYYCDPFETLEQLDKYYRKIL